MAARPSSTDRALPARPRRRAARPDPGLGRLAGRAEQRGALYRAIDWRRLRALPPRRRARDVHTPRVVRGEGFVQRIPLAAPRREVGMRHDLHRSGSFLPLPPATVWCERTRARCVLRWRCCGVCERVCVSGPGVAADGTLCSCSMHSVQAMFALARSSAIGHARFACISPAFRSTAARHAGAILPPGTWSAIGAG